MVSKERPSAHLDGLRGAMAVYVLFFHSWTIIAGRPSRFPHGAIWAHRLSFLEFGHGVVCVFIVLSGYCLAARLVGRDRLFDVREFFRRRARRILPAYVLVLFVSLIPFLGWADLRHYRVAASHIVVGVVTHLLLIHNLDPDLCSYINATLWSVGLECQIYVVFALVLIPVWKRWGWGAQLAVAATLGLAPHFLLHGWLDWTAPWLLGLFALGVAAAEFSLRRDSPRLPWATLTGLAVIAVVVAMQFHHFSFADGPGGRWVFSDALIGIAAGLFLIACRKGTAFALPMRVLSLPALVQLGDCSYSILLVQHPILLYVNVWLSVHHIGEGARFTAFGLVILGIIGLGRLSYVFVERPFLAQSQVRPVKRTEEMRKLLETSPVSNMA